MLPEALGQKVKKALARLDTTADEYAPPLHESLQKLSALLGIKSTVDFRTLDDEISTLMGMLPSMAVTSD